MSEEWPSRSKLDRARREIGKCRAGIHNTDSRDLVRIARWLGRELDGKRGKEPTYVNRLLLGARPISIPDKVRGDGTKYNILTDLEADVEQWEALLDEN